MITQVCDRTFEETEFFQTSLQRRTPSDLKTPFFFIIYASGVCFYLSEQVVQLTEVQHEHVVVADRRVPTPEHVNIPLLNHTGRVPGSRNTSVASRVWRLKLKLNDWTQLCHPDRGEGLSPVTMGWYQMDRWGSKMYNESLQPSGSGLGRGNTPPSTKSSPRNMLQLW